MRKKLSPNIFLFLAFIITISSCVNRKQIVYFQKGAHKSDTIAAIQAYVPKIQPGDILGIAVASLNSTASGFFNPYSASGADASGSGGGAASVATAAPGFLVDSAGTIELPLIGPLKVAGLNTSQARDLIKSHLTTYLKEPTVNVRFLNYKISVLGEVAHPSVYIIPNERITITEAISMAGDLTIYGKRTNVMVIRDVDGKKEFGSINLNGREIFNSPYYYLHSGDVLYVEQGKGKIAASDEAFRIIPLVLTSLSVIILAIYRFR
ncbi:polysaccharide biosynthesis/export family protein [Mucilaginibacter xinganensis]|nr:polysaccharide biosynthesis/export family protein [Mucilaginibacter xinganensis]